jgi:signal transduction histidine kinase
MISLFQKKPDAGNSKSVTEALYKQNLELAVKNKTLSLLGKLYEISIMALEPEELAERVTKAIQDDFSFELVGVLLYNKEKDALSPLAFAESERFSAVEAASGISLKDISVTDIKKNVFFVPIKDGAKMGYTENIKDIWSTLIPVEMRDKIKTDAHVASSLVYPIIIGSNFIGVLLLCLNRDYNHLIGYEKDSIKSIVNVIDVALDKSILYKEIKIANDKLKIANQGQANLIHIMNHQIKGYLAKSRNIFSELLTEPAYGPVSEAGRPMIEEGFKSLTEGVQFVQQILTTSSAENGTLNYEMQPLDFKELVMTAIEKERGRAEEKGLSLETSIGDGDFRIKGDQTHLKEAVKNLIDNSIIYTKSGGLKIDLSKEGATHKIILSIKDTGIGLTAEDKERLFTKGGRGKDSLKINVNSSGFGLAFVKGVVDAHKGRIWAVSPGRDQGSTFFLELPTATSA